MFGIGSTELLVILVVALVVLGPKSLPGIAKTMGKVMGEFRRVTTEFQRTMNAEVADEEHKKRKKEAEEELFGHKDATDDETTKKPDAKKTSAKASVETPVHTTDANTGVSVTDTTATAMDREQTTASSDTVHAPAPDSPLAQALAKAEAEAADYADSAKNVRPNTADVAADVAKDKA